MRTILVGVALTFAVPCFGQVAEQPVLEEPVIEQPVDEAPEYHAEPNFAVYDLQLYAAESSDEGTVQFAESDSGCMFAAGDFDLQSGGVSYEGSWFGFGWGPIQSRFGIGTAENGNALLKSVTFGNVLLGRLLVLDELGRNGYIAVGEPAESVEEPTPEEPIDLPENPDQELPACVDPSTDDATLPGDDAPDEVSEVGAPEVDLPDVELPDNSIDLLPDGLPPLGL